MVVRHSPSLVLAAACLIAVGCSTPSKVTRKPSRLPDRSQTEREEAAQVKLLPWETWQPFQDLQGQRLSNRDLLTGDEYFKFGKRRSALEAYVTATKVPLLPREAEAAALRLSSSYLALGEPGKALSTISAYFKKKGLSESQVTPPFGLILAFAYGETGDVDQSLAWFSRVRSDSNRGPESEVATRGSALLVRSLSPEKFEVAATNWHTDEFISQQIGRERLRRASQSSSFEVAAAVPFWKAYDDVSLSSTAPIAGEPVGAAPVVGLLVGLSDKFSALGKDTKQGFELAVEAAREEPKLQLMVRDVGTDPAVVSGAVRELVGGAKASVVVGPILSDAATVAADTARELNAPLIALSKSDTFQTGGSVFRLGATTASQIDALVTAAYKDRRMTRFAVAYPQSATGIEYQQAFKKKLETLGLSTVLEVSYVTSDDTSLARAAQEIEQSTAEAVLIPDNIDTSARLLSNLSPSTRRKIRPMGTALWDNPVKIANSQALFEYSFFVTAFFANSTRPAVKQFVESYRGRFNSAPSFLAAQGFDTGTLVVNALRKSRAEGVPFAQALMTLPAYEGVTGYITPQRPEGLHRSFYVVEVSADSFLESMPGAAPAADTKVPSDSAISFRGNQRVEPQTGEPMLNKDEMVDSGY
jgi:branched-chain amino acid transport system substrate-binding protein